MFKGLYGEIRGHQTNEYSLLIYSYGSDNSLNVVASLAETCGHSGWGTNDLSQGNANLAVALLEDIIKSVTKRGLGKIGSLYYLSSFKEENRFELAWERYGTR
ncbi:MAG: hypothetical protein AABW79_02920 [Nanoarchaeota archaeon]